MLHTHATTWRITPKNAWMFWSNPNDFRRQLFSLEHIAIRECPNALNSGNNRWQTRLLLQRYLIRTKRRRKKRKNKRKKRKLDNDIWYIFRCQISLTDLSWNEVELYLVMFNNTILLCLLISSYQFLWSSFTYSIIVWFYKICKFKWKTLL